MKPNLKLEVLAPLQRTEPDALDAFDEGRVRLQLARFAHQPGLFAGFVERARSRFQKAGERAILEHWVAFYGAGQRLVAAKTELERKKNEYRQLAHEYEIKAAEKQTNLSKLEADTEEHRLRRDKAAHQRQHLGSVGAIAAPAISENEQKLNEAQERRALDARWELNESLKALNTLIELQRWRREQRDRILKDRLLTTQEQHEALQFVDDLYEQKRGELRVDTRIFEEA